MFDGVATPHQPERITAGTSQIGGERKRFRPAATETHSCWVGCGRNEVEAPRPVATKCDRYVTRRYLLPIGQHHHERDPSATERRCFDLTPGARTVRRRLQIRRPCFRPGHNPIANLRRIERSWHRANTHAEPSLVAVTRGQRQEDGCTRPLRSPGSTHVARLGWGWHLIAQGGMVRYRVPNPSVRSTVTAQSPRARQ